jgi:integrase
MSESSESRRSRKVPDRPKKPYPDFPLYPHPLGYWSKKIRGTIRHFGRWGRVVNGKLTARQYEPSWQEALALYKAQADDLHAGRTPRLQNDGLTVKDLCNQFLTAKLRKVEAAELTSRMFAEYKLMTDMTVAAFGATRFVDDLAADDFAGLQATMAKKWGPLRVLNGITRVKSIFKFTFESSLINRTPRYGPEFAPPSRSVLRRHRAKSPPKMFEPHELRQLIEMAGVPWKAMILLGVNCGFGNHDCATLQEGSLKPDQGWVDFPRPKTGIPRRCPLWPETVEAIQTALGARLKPASAELGGTVFLTYRGTAWVRVGTDTRSDYLSIHFNKLLKKLGLHHSGFGFYTLRHVFGTIADAARDIPAVRAIMGHVDASIDAAYRERIEDSRLRAVADHVRNWLFPTETPTDTKPEASRRPSAGCRSGP